MTRKLNIAYVGFGKSTNRYHIPYVQTRNNLNIARVVSPVLGERPEQAQLEATGTIFSTNNADIINDPRIDLVDIVTPAPFHYEIAKEFLLAGKNVLCDKPLVEELEQAKELVEIAKEKKLFFMPFQNRRFDSDFLTVKKVIETGYLGKLSDITVHMDHYRPHDAATRGEKFDGAWYGHGVHMVDQMVSLFGKPKNVQYDIRHIRDGKTDDYFSVNLIYDGLRVTVAASETAAVPHPKWTLYGDRGTFIKKDVDQQENDLKLDIMPGTEGFGLDSPSDYGQLVYFNQNDDRIEKTIPTIAGDYARVYDAVYESIINGADKLVSDEQILSVIEILEKGFD